MTSYGKVKVVRTKAWMDEIPDNCGYMQKFEHNIDLNSNGVMGECIEWCHENCTGRWGWWFDPAGDIKTAKNHWENQNAYMSFQRKKDATRFWLAVGLKNSGIID